MKITVLGETVAMEGVRLIRKEVRVYTLKFPDMETNPTTHEVNNKVYHNPKVVIDKIMNKVFEGEEHDTHVEINLNKPLDHGIQPEQLQDTDI